jgi:putative transposase
MERRIPGKIARSELPREEIPFTEQQIVGILKESEAGAKTADSCRKHGVSPAAFYNWKSRFGGMEVIDVVKMRALEDENRRLKKLLADSAFEIDALKLTASGNF